jgi:Holliday junction resolvasome RuvABC endonuclease subunit
VSRPQGILSLDLASSTGWAYSFPGDEPQYGSCRFAPPGCEVGRFAMLGADWLDAQLAVHRPRIVVYEAPILVGAKTTPETVEKLMGLVFRLKELCYRRDIPVGKKYDSSTVCKWFTGRGRYGDRAEKKAAVMRACVALGWKPDDDDAGDALALLCYATSILAPKVPAKRWLGPLLGCA